MDPETLRLLQRLRMRNLTLTRELRARLDRFVTARWDALGSWEDADMVRLLNEILPVVEAAERRMVDLTNTFLAATAAAASGRAFRPRAPRYAELTGEALRGVAPSTVFMRPQMVVNYQLSRGASLPQAVGAGRRRLRSLAATNVQLAKTHTVAAQGTGAFYRRVLTGDENCALCVIASTQRYRRGDLAPIHPGCDCAVEEIVDAMPPHVIAPELLEETHREINSQLDRGNRSAFDLDIGKTNARGERISDYTDLIVVRRHGELGPVLAWRKDHFRGPAEAARLAS